MIYPTFNIQENNTHSIVIIDSSYSKEPVLELHNDEDKTEDDFAVFITLLMLFVNNYNDGWYDGWNDALDLFNKGEK